MSRYLGSVNKKARRYGFSILETGKEFAKGKKRTYAPGQHGKRRIKLSNYGQQVQEKQKVRFMYGLTERQFRNTYKKSQKMEGIAGTNFLILLESRLDNIVYRMGLAVTRQAARQMVNHGHILVNGKKNDIPSFTCKIGDEISIKESHVKTGQEKQNDSVEPTKRKKTNFTKNVKMLESLKSQAKTLEFVKFDKAKLKGTYVRHPERSELNQEINDALIVE